MHKIVALALAFFLGLTPAAAQNMCMAHGALAGHLAKAYAEQPASAGLGADGMLFEVFVSPRGLLTVVGTSPGGVSCIRAVGKAWTRIPTAENVDRPAF